MVPTILFSLVRIVLSILGFSIGGRRRGGGTTASQQRTRGHGEASSRRRGEGEESSSQRRKMFDADEGEYVDFEEIKDGE